MCFHLLQTCWNGAFLKRQTVNNVVQGAQKHISCLIASWHCSKGDAGGGMIRCSVPNRNIREGREIKANPKRYTYSNQVCESRWCSILDGSVWQMKVDLVRNLVFPDVIQTTLRPDIVLWSAEDHHHHRAKSVVGRRLRRGPRTKELKVLETEGGMSGSLPENLVIPVEVGCRGFPARSVWTLLKAIGICGAS